MMRSLNQSRKAQKIKYHVFTGLEETLQERDRFLQNLHAGLPILQRCRDLFVASTFPQWIQQCRQPNFSWTHSLVTYRENINQFSESTFWMNNFALVLTLSFSDQFIYCAFTRINHIFLNQHICCGFVRINHVFPALRICCGFGRTDYAFCRQHIYFCSSSINHIFPHSHICGSCSNQSRDPRRHIGYGFTCIKHVSPN